MRCPALLAFIFLARGLFASEDPLIASFSQPLAPGHWDTEISAEYLNEAHWADRNGDIVNFNGVNQPGIPDNDGIVKSVKGYVFDLRLLWAPDKNDLLEAWLPYDNIEFSAYTPGQTTPTLLDDPTVRRADASGDLGLAYRRLLVGGGPLRLGLGLEVTGPTGQGPFESANPFVATGAGGFSAAATLDAETGYKGFLLWTEERVPYLLAYQADIPQNTIIAYDPSGNPETLNGGTADVSSGFSYSALLGLGWDWYVTEKVRHRIALEVQWVDQGEIILSGQGIPDTERKTLNVVPEARFAFNEGFAVNLGVYLPNWYATNQPVGSYPETLLGTYLIRVDLNL